MTCARSILIPRGSAGTSFRPPLEPQQIRQVEIVLLGFVVFTPNLRAGENRRIPRPLPSAGTGVAI
jgi:hypothetical protein